MLYQLNGHVFSSFGATPEYVVKGDRVTHGGVTQKISTMTPKERADFNAWLLRQKHAAQTVIKTQDFSITDAQWQKDYPWYRDYAATVSYSVREQVWRKSGTPTRPDLQRYAISKEIRTPKDIQKDWSKTQKKIADAQAYVAAAAQAVKNVQALNPQTSQQDLVASAARVISTAASGGGGGSAPASQPIATEAPAQTATGQAAAAASPVTGIAGAGLAAAGLWLMFGL